MPKHPIITGDRSFRLVAEAVPEEQREAKRVTFPDGSEFLVIARGDAFEWRAVFIDDHTGGEYTRRVSRPSAAQLERLLLAELLA